MNKKSVNRPADSLRRMVRLIRGHSKDCYAVAAVKRGDWKTPWAGLVEEVRWLSVAGDRRGNSKPWLVVRCNCTHCPALKMVSSDVLAEIEPNQ